MKGVAIKILAIGVFFLATLTPDWKTQLIAQAGGCSPHEGIGNPNNYGSGMCLEGTYKGSIISEFISNQ